MKLSAQFLLLFALPAFCASDLTQVEVFRSGEGGYHTCGYPR